MKKMNFVMGIIASALLIVYYISLMVGAIGTENGAEGAAAFILLIIAFVLLALTYRARAEQTTANGVWTIILGTVCGFIPVFAMIMIAVTGSYAENILVAVIGSLCTFAIIARGIMTLKLKKSPYEFDDTDRGAVVREKNAGSITGAVLALLGGLTNAVFGVITLIQMFEWDLFGSNSGMEEMLALFYIFILIFSLVGAIVLLFNRFQGGIYILTSSLLALVFASISLAYQDQSAVLFILPLIALIASAVIGLMGYNKTKKLRAEEQSISAGS